ncbi:MAG: D-alanyl-D-alanine carboxypeptidase [Desulfobacteraceae bacterium]|nr:D-alanyl-D-alanine carboxypeptidase [Desulfobacteraceae bacterium]
MKSFLFTSAVFAAAVMLFFPGPAFAGRWDKVSGMLGRDDGAIVISGQNRVMFAKNPDKPLVPASTLKLVTALAAFYHLGPEFRFKTEFYLDSDDNLVIKGYGDPLLISEEVEKIAKILAGRINEINDVVPDNSRFAADIGIPGTRPGSSQPYDAPIGALCVNFNTVNVKKTKNGYVSAEPQTPLLPSVSKRIMGKNPPEERILLSSKNSENLIYAGELFAHFLKANGVDIKGEIRTGRANPEKDALVYSHRSGFALTEVTALLMEYSNNFIANQLFIAAGTEAYGPPGTLEKGLRAVKSYVRKEMGISPQIVEGSGISRQNRMTAGMFVPVLKAFAPYYKLLPEDNGIYCKTGTLDHVRNRAGYIEKNGRLFGFAVLVNTPEKKAKPVVEEIVSVVK